MNYSTMIDSQASKPTVIDIKLFCPDCGKPEHATSIRLHDHTIYECGRVDAYTGNGEWATICPCPTVLISALQSVRNCGNTCLVCSQEIDGALQQYNAAPASQ